MVAIRNINDIISGLIDYFKLVQPDLDTKPGTVARDLFIEAPSSQLALIYQELSNVSNLQSLLAVSGANLDKLAKNFGLTRTQSTPSSGVALLTFNSLEAPFAVNAQDLITARNGLAFRVTSGVAINPSSASVYKSTADRFRNDLDFVGIKDQYAIQVLIQCTTAGSIGNISKYYLSRSVSPGINGVTNVSSFSGGSDQESDTSFRNRILAIFNGSSVGTALGYKNVALSSQNVLDALVIEPGDPLMTRDGTVVSVAPDGTRTIVSEGSGGKVDIIVLGQNLLQTLDSFVYVDKSNSNDPTNEKNTVVIGQISGDENKTINRRRIDNIKSNTLPSQPVESIISVTGSLSGANFKQKTVDSLGRVFGNYELVKDTSEYAGSPWGFDKFKWISNKITDFPQDVSRQNFNTQDQLSYTDLIKSSAAQQNIFISNENSKVTSDRSIIQLLHYPCSNVTRVYNVNTGERYFVSNQNVDGTDTVNKTGRIKISGNTLPLSTDVLQVDYTWVFNYDPHSDYDGKYLNDNIRDSVDSIDWGYSSKIKDERILFTLISGNYEGTSSHNISSVASVNLFREVDGTVYIISSGVNSGRKAIKISQLSMITGIDGSQFALNGVNSVNNIVLKNTFKEVYSTPQGDGFFIFENKDCTIVLPTDTIASENDYCSVVFNSTNIYNDNSTFSSNKIIIPEATVQDALNLDSISNVFMNVSYVADIGKILSSPVKSFPLTRASNGFFDYNYYTGNYSQTNTLRRENKLIQQSGTETYLELDISSNDFSLTAENVLAIVRNSDGAVLWDALHLGTVSTYGTLNKFKLILNSSVTASLADQVIVFYYAVDKNRIQPFTYSNNRVLSSVSQIDINSDSKYYVPMFNFVENLIPVKFQLIDITYQSIYGQALDGYITNNSSYLELSTNSSQFNNISDLTQFKIKIEDPNNFNNNSIFDIVSFDKTNKVFTIKVSLESISNNQISITRLVDGKEVWSESCSLNVDTGQLIIDNTNFVVNKDDYVFINYYSYNNLRRSPCNISSTLFDQNVSNGTVLLEGVTLSKIEGAIVTSINNGLKVDLTEAVMKWGGYQSFSAIPSTIKIARVVSLEKVQTAGNSSDVVSGIVSYDLKNSKINDNSFYINEFLQDTSLGRFEITLPSTSINTTFTSSSPNSPRLGDKLRVTLYVSNSADSESLNYTNSGTLFSNKKFALINKIQTSGFKTSSSSIITMNMMNQPTAGTRYKVFYDYLAPKQNERITINYNYNQTIGDVTLRVENNRPINADVIVKQANKILVDVTMYIVVAQSYINSSGIVSQDVKDAIMGAINTNTLGAVIDNSDLINVAYGVSGVDRVRITYFNKNGVLGQALTITAQSNEYLVANNVIVNVETR